MSRLISRQEAIDTLRTMQTYKLFEGHDMLLIDQAEAMTELMMLPPAQPYTEDEIQKMQDLESVMMATMFRLGREDALSEIVRCKDCRHFYEEPADPFWDRCDSTAWYDGDGNDQYVKPTDYCSYAERKEGADG